jgi:fucose permease
MVRRLVGHAFRVPRVDDARFRHARLGVSIVFFAHGLASGTWLARIPAVQEHLALGDAALGLALLGAGLGSLLAMVPAGAMIARYGSRAMSTAFGVPCSAALCLIAIAASWPMLFGALVLWGASAGSLDVAMNAQGSAIQNERGRPILSSLHGLWSLGTMAGGAISAGLTTLGVGVEDQLLSEAPLLLVLVLLASRPMLPGGHGSAGAAFARPERALLALAVVVFCGVAAEGGMYDWAGVYLRQAFDAQQSIAASATAWVAGSMAIGRLVGDVFTARFGAPALARACAALAAVGMLIVILAPGPGIVFSGLVALGFGLSILVPLAFGAAGRAPGVAPGAAIAAVATVGYFGFVVTPPTIGFVAEHLTLRGAFVLLLALLILIGVLAPATGDPERVGAYAGERASN